MTHQHTLSCVSQTLLLTLTCVLKFSQLGPQVVIMTTLVLFTSSQVACYSCCFGDATKKGAERCIGWVALPAEGCGEHHLQLRPSPLPKSATEARSPAAEPLDCWVHCELTLAVTGSLASFAQSVKIRDGATSEPAKMRAFGRRSMNADAARASDILVYLLTRTSRKHFFSALNSRSQQPCSSAPASMAALMHAP